MKSSNGSSGLAAAGAVSFAEGTWDVSVLAGEADVYYDLVFKGLDVPVRHNGTLIAFSVERAASQNLSFGVDLEYLETSLALNSPVFQQLPELLKPQAELDMTKITLNATYDTRDNTFFPTSGMLASAKIGYALDVSSILQGGLELERNRYNKSIFSLASYHEVGNTGVLAARGVLCSSSSQAPFFDNCGIGLASGLRGFPTMEFIDEASATAQVEYRGRINDRFGYVAFAAIGGGGPKISSLSLNEGGVSFGAGLRIRLSKKYKLDYAIDYAQNNNSEGYLYITLGQKF
nr:BamA/TamA family outer membrane protein [Pseudophaeobacter flagellatus]